MPASAKHARTRTREKDGTGGLQHRIRHITSLQVRNLTPFPFRDEFAVALVQPSEQSQFTAHGHLSDDLDLTVSRKRGRKRSSTSVGALSWYQSPEHDVQSVPESSGRKRTLSRASTYSVGATSMPKTKPSSSSVPARPLLRQRTLSTASSSSFTASTSHESTVPASLSLSGFLQDTSQDALEHIVQSRLVETFLTLTAVPSGTTAPGLVVESPSHGHRPTTVTTSSHEDMKMRRRSTIASSAGSSLSRSSTLSKGSLSSITSEPSFLRAEASGHSKASSVSSLPSSKGSLKPSPSKPLSQRSSTPRSSVASKTPSSPFSASAGSDPQLERPIPDYISPILKASTNPLFEIDTQGGFEFSPDTDLRASKIVVEIWGRLSHNVKDNRKGKERAHSFPTDSEGGTHEWRILKTWDIDLNKLELLTDDLARHPSRLPSNTLCITLEPFGRTYYLQPSRPSTSLFCPSRSPSPSTGYNSDPECNLRNIDVTAPIAHTDTPKPQDSPVLGPQSQHESEAEEGTESHHTRWERSRTSASWQSLMKLVTLQAVIQDTERSVSKLRQEVAPYLVEGSTVALNRELSERDARVSDLRSGQSYLEEKSDDLRVRVRQKRDELQNRRKMLAAAYEAHWTDIRQESELDLCIDAARTDIVLLRSRLSPLRNELLTTLAFMFPIELLSPPDLLFTILDVPLPIPIGPTDPAPPLVVSSRKDITEDTVATALGYAAQVVQLLAAYLGQRLVYPITCVGSRSVIKDGISAMVGPRMFPLFSKGVDTYRFEYGVFLLNKNIEMLMSERDLRALDTRHTLPNLKNLLLTLTDPDTIAPRLHRPSSIASTTISALQSPVLSAAVDPTETNSQRSSELDSTDPLTPEESPRIEIDSPPASGSTTPTASAATPTSTVRKSKAFLDLTPLSGFWKSRNQSSSRSSVKAEPPLEEDHAGEATPTLSSATINFVQVQGENSAGSGDDEDDRRTIRGRAGTSSEEDGVPEHKVRSKAGLANGNINGASHLGDGAAKEKVASQLRMESRVVNGVS